MRKGVSWPTEVVAHVISHNYELHGESQMKREAYEIICANEDRNIAASCREGWQMMPPAPTQPSPLLRVLDCSQRSFHGSCSPNAIEGNGKRYGKAELMCWSLVLVVSVLVNLATPTSMIVTAAASATALVKVALEPATSRVKKQRKICKKVGGRRYANRRAHAFA